MDKPEILSAPHPLRILLIVNLHWDARLGAVRVYMELAERWRAAGHIVEHFSLSDAFPNSRGARASFAVHQVRFAYKAAAFVRKNAHRFDIVDAIIGSLHGSKQNLRFDGLLVARSVGLYRLYERFERNAESRWPRRPRGKFFGRILYTLFRYWLNRASDEAVKNADLVNVPNEDEADCLRKEFGVSTKIVVQPYGLTAERRDAIFAAAVPPAARLHRRKISFIGMWGPRKGSFDWPNIVRAVWRRIPEARFSFLGTMVESETVLSDLGLKGSERIESVSQYSPDELPRLLADCAVGAFPSYVEGFGLGVIEQLAAGLPTVAFDVPGPRNILRSQLPELLVASGDVEKFAEAICRILELDAPLYETLAKRSADTAAMFDWSTIARDTLEIYRERLTDRARKILFIQPFSLGSSGGGGARILRALLEHAPMAWQSVCCSPRKPKQWPNEIHLPSRPSWGKIETSRLARYPKMTMSIFASGFRRRLKAFCQRANVVAIHTVPHSGLDFVQAQSVARDLALPFFISLHDDLAYTTARELRPSVREPAMRAAWLEADARFVISDALGQEYSRRYGEREYQIVTDGLNELPSPRPASPAKIRRIYFMGLFHLTYEPNLRALLEAIAILERENPETKFEVTCRCEYIRPHVWKDLKRVQVLPFADEAQIARDMQDVDLVYMPMPFGQEHENFTRYSVSTKMVTYVGSGIPIVYHGPATSAAFELLHRNNAAIFLTTLDAPEIAKSLTQITGNVSETIVANALALARREFMIADQTRKFWNTICACIRAR